MLNRIANPVVTLSLLLSATVAIAGEPWHGHYAPQMDMTGMPAQMQQFMLTSLPQFEFDEDAVDMMVGGKVSSSSPYQMDGQVAVVETDQGTKRVTFNDDFSAFTVNGGDGTPYTRQ